MTATSFNMNDESFYHTSFTLQNSETSPNTYYQVPSYSDNSNDICLEQDIQPFLEIVVQPCDKFRFRYNSETGSHGKVRGPEKNRSKTNFPTVKLHNWDDSQGKIEIKASLYTYEEQPRPHILELVGKNCKHGGCWENLSDNDIAIFRFLEIENKRKEEAMNILMEKRMKRAGRRQNKEKIREEAQEEFKLLNMNCAILCFEAFQNGKPISGKVFSSPIKNLKSTSSDLKISRISSCSGSCKGGDDVILLCDKINKDDIEIHFYEKDEYDAVLWKENGEFNPKVDVHHQVAIVFKTPAYKHNFVGTVYMELYRRSDKQSSEPRIFTYIPDEIDALRDSKKRKLNSYESVDSGIGQAAGSSGWESSPSSSGMEDNDGLIGSPLQDESGNLICPTLSYEGNQLEADVEHLFQMVGLEKLIDYNFSANEVQSQLHIDAAEPLDLYPEPIFQEEDTGSMEFTVQDYSILPTRSILQEDFDDTEFNSEEFSMLPMAQSLPVIASGSTELNDHAYSILPPMPNDNGRITLTSGRIYRDSEGSFTKTIIEDLISLTPLPYLTDLAIDKLKSGIDIMVSSVKQAHDSKKDKAISKSGRKDAAANNSFKPSDDKIYAQSGLIFDMSHLSIKDDGKKVLKNNVSMESPIVVDPQSSRANTYREENKGYKNASENNQNFEHFKESINCILKNREISVYLQYISKLMSVIDEDGNTFLHLAVKEQSENVNLISRIVKICPDFVNKQNNFKETPLHLAAKINAYKVMFLLLSKDGNPSILDAKGNNCFHITSEFNFTKSMTIMLFPSLKEGKYIPSIDNINYEGLAPVHLAVLNNAKECLNLLLQAGADVNIKDRKSGSSPLNLALKLQSSLVLDLLSHPHIDLLNGDFQGDTFVHALCNMKGVPMPRISQSTDLVYWARKTLTLPSVDACESSETDFSDEESDNEEETMATASREYLPMAQPFMHNDVDQNSLNEECEEQLSNYLDAGSRWRKLGLSIGFDEKILNGLETLSKDSSPSKVILRKIKVLYKNCDKQTLINILILADLKDAVKILK